MPVLRLEAIDQVREWTHFADVLQAANPVDRSFDAEVKAFVWHATILAQIDVLLIHSK
jgi:hypothetical protein